MCRGPEMGCERLGAGTVPAVIRGVSILVRPGDRQPGPAGPKSPKAIPAAVMSASCLNAAAFDLVTAGSRAAETEASSLSASSGNVHGVRYARYGLILSCAGNKHCLWDHGREGARQMKNGQLISGTASMGTARCPCPVGSQECRRAFSGPEPAGAIRQVPAPGARSPRRPRTGRHRSQ